MQKKLLAAAATATTLGGAAAGATLLAPGFAGAQDEGSTTTAPSTTDGTTTDDARPDRGEHIAEALQGLVDDGTLTEAQVDAVIEALEAARPDFGDHGGPGRVGRGFGGGFEGGADLADILGMDSSDLRDALAGGQTLAEIAEAQGVDTQVLVDALVAAAEDRVNQAVENGRIDQDKADEILADAETRAEDMVNGEFELRGPGHRGFGPGGEMPPGADTADDTADDSPDA
ncbi:MAG: hypothetical protein R2695_03145 [Acidimicrobiales bacterium]